MPQTKKGTLAICNECGMSGLAEHFDEKEICRKCRKIVALEKAIEDQQGRLSALEETVKTLSEATEVKGPRSYADCAKETSPKTAGGSRKIVIKEPVPSQKEQPKKRETLVYVGEDDKCQPKVLVVGGSNTRYIGSNLVAQSSQFMAISRSGARIEDIGELLEEGGTEVETCVVDLGTNNLLREENKEIEEKYKQLITELKQRKKRIMLMGILPRRDISAFHHRRRLDINSTLRQLCKDEGIEYLDMEFNALRSDFLVQDGLHLNRSGSDMVARRIFNAVKCTCKTCKCKPLN